MRSPKVRKKDFYESVVLKRSKVTQLIPQMEGTIMLYVWSINYIEYKQAVRPLWL